MRLPHDNIEGSVMTGLVEGIKPWRTNDQGDQGHAGLTTSWRGLTSHETEGVGRH